MQPKEDNVIDPKIAKLYEGIKREDPDLFEAMTLAADDAEIEERRCLRWGVDPATGRRICIEWG